MRRYVAEIPLTSVALLCGLQNSLDFAFSPNRLPAHTGPAGGPQIRQELRQISAILGNARETAQRMLLSGAARPPRCFLVGQIAVRHQNLRGAFDNPPKVDVQRTSAIK